MKAWSGHPRQRRSWAMVKADDEEAVLETPWTGFWPGSPWIAEAVFERVEDRFGFLEAPGILKQAHQSQPDTGGLEAAAHLEGKLVGPQAWFGISDASDVLIMLRSP